MTNVVQGNFITLADIEPDQILEGAKGALDVAMVIGKTKDGRLYVASTTADLFITSGYLRMATRHIENMVAEDLK